MFSILSRDRLSVKESFSVALHGSIPYRCLTLIQQKVKAHIAMFRGCGVKEIRPAAEYGNPLPRQMVSFVSAAHLMLICSASSNSGKVDYYETE